MAGVLRAWVQSFRTAGEEFPGSLLWAVNKKHHFLATVVVCTSKVGRHSRAAIKQAEKAENRDFRQVRSGMQSVWASPQQGGQSGQKVWPRSGRAGKWVTEAAKYVVLLV